MNRASFSLLVALILVGALVAFLFPAGSTLAAPSQQSDNPNPPDHVVKLIFIHHSTGGNWLAVPAQNELGGNLGRALMENNYYVSATNYGWGPDSIGDATDIPNWLDWFRGENSATYLDALYNEDGQNFGDFGSWPRLADDPGGENQIILFKSCFPNSELEGSSNDAPNPDGWLSVGHAKYVYNEILQYFGTRPDKLFVVITAPPLSASNTSPGASANARAFNEWLLNDWLHENNYTLNNVAVFDFYNVLTGPDNHHRWTGSQIEHTFVPGKNNLYYPSGDDHPSRAGNRKATEEFVPLLNIFYNRWQSGSAQLLPVGAPEVTPLPFETPADAAVSESGGPGVPLPPETVLSIDAFEAGANGWTAFRDETTSTTVSCGAEQGTGSNGSASLRIDFSVTPGSWATCALFFDTPQDWSGGEWLSFDIHSEKSGQPFNVIVYGGTPDSRETYIQKRETPVEYPEGYIPFTSMWKDFLRAEWEDKAGLPFELPEQVTGLAFGFDAGPDALYTGSVWIDNIQLKKSPTYPESGNPLKKGLPCLGSALLPLLVVAFAWLFRRR